MAHDLILGLHHHHTNLRLPEPLRLQKLARSSSKSTVGAAIVEVECSFERDYTKMGVPGWKERYYEEKFSAKSSKELGEIRRDVVKFLAF
ncbi:putative 5'-3' exoribonuclease, xrn1, helical domain-containing protein [Helianthus anomalus]